MTIRLPLKTKTLPQNNHSRIDVDTHQSPLAASEEVLHKRYHIHTKNPPCAIKPQGGFFQSVRFISSHSLIQEELRAAIEAEILDAALLESSPL